MPRFPKHPRTAILRGNNKLKNNNKHGIKQIEKNNIHFPLPLENQENQRFVKTAISGKSQPRKAEEILALCKKIIDLKKNRSEKNAQGKTSHFRASRDGGILMTKARKKFSFFFCWKLINCRKLLARQTTGYDSLPVLVSCFWHFGAHVTGFETVTPVHQNVSRAQIHRADI